jgi:glyoxylate/hydroxypyruvate reductase A
MGHSKPIQGVLLSETFDLKTFYRLDFSDRDDPVRLFDPPEVVDPAAIRFAVCWQPGPEAFAPYATLEMAMSVGAGVEDLLAHPGLGPRIAICRVRDPHQAALMAGYAAHEVLHAERNFPEYAQAQARRAWAPLPMTAPRDRKVAVLGNGTMGAAVARALAALGFTVAVACRRPPSAPLPGVTYHTGETAIAQAAEGAGALVNVLPLTAQTRTILNRALFDRLAQGAWLVQIGRGEHLHEADFQAALDSGQLAGASLDVFRQEPLPADHPFWGDPRLRITPHIASDSTPQVVREQILLSARELLAGTPLGLSVDAGRGY